MEQLTIIGSEDDRLILADESGQRFTLAIDAVLRDEVRSYGREVKPVAVLAASPRDIQARIRAGLSAEETSDLLGVDIDVVRKFETPVLAEREHIVDRALAVPVVIGTEFDLEENPTFGSAVRSKLADLRATGERWTSWKDEHGWSVKLDFTAADVDHDARWSFDPRRSALAPLNSDANQLSRQGPLPEGLIPKLRAVDHASQAQTSAPAAAAPPAEPEEDADQGGETLDLLEALRRRRGQREPAPTSEIDESASRHPAKGPSRPVSLFDLPGVQDASDGAETAAAPADAPLDDADAGRADDAADTPESADSARNDSSRKRGGRAAMPSWDEIVFGARSDD